jgi:hypothetical protein
MEATTTREVDPIIPQVKKLLTPAKRADWPSITSVSKCTPNRTEWLSLPAVLCGKEYGGNNKRVYTKRYPMDSATREACYW